jgi:hypothetical protein
VVPLSGLAPNTQYYYAIGSAAGALVGDDADHVFRTPPLSGSSVFPTARVNTTAKVTAVVP